MKRAIVTLVILFRVSLAFAELPLSLTEALFEITGGKDYDQWLKLHGPVIFPQKFSCFQGGIFRSRFDKNPPFGLRYEIVMQHEFVGKTNVAEVVPDIKKAERLLLGKFKSKRFSVTVSSNKYHSVCRNIDRRGWSVEFSITQIGETNAPIAAARFYNPLHRDGRFRSCEDSSDASKVSSTKQETLNNYTLEPTTHCMSAKEQSYSIAMQILREHGKPESFATIKACNDVDALRIVAFAAKAAAWSMEAGSNREFDEGIDSMLIMALERLFVIDSEVANETIEYYKRAFPPDGAYSLFFKAWEEERKSLRTKRKSDARYPKSTTVSPQNGQP